MRLHRQETIDRPRFLARRHSCLFTSELKEFKDETAEFLIKTEQKKPRNKQNIWMLSSLCGVSVRINAYILEPCREIGQKFSKKSQKG